MRKLLVLPALLLAAASFAQDKGKPPVSVNPTDSARPAAPKKPSITDKVKSSKKFDGLFTVYQDTANGSMLLYVKKNQLGKEYIYQSFAMGGPTSLFLNQNMIRTTWVFKIKKSFDKLEFSQ